MVRLTCDTYGSFARSKEVVAVLFDAPAWDKTGWAIMQPVFQQAEMELGESAALGFVDVDGAPEREICRNIPVLNVPCVAYYRGGELVAGLVGMDQDVVSRVQAVIAGESIGHKDGRVLPYAAINRLRNPG